MEELKFRFINVGYGEAMLLECPDPAFRGGIFVMLIDGGSAEASEFADRSTGRIPLREYLETRGPDHIDLMVNTHFHEDHVGALPSAAELLPPAELWQALPAAFWRETMRPLDPAAARNLSQEKLLRALNGFRALCAATESAGGAVRAMAPGMSGALCAGLRYTVLGPGAEKLEELRSRCAALYAEQDGEAFLERLSALDAAVNNYSLVLLLDYRGTRLLLPGDTNVPGCAGIDPALLRADFFKVGHHGQRDGADPALMDAIQAKTVVCCAGSDRRYNSAHPELLGMMESRGAKLYFSDCPSVPGQVVPPHSAVEFTVGENGEISAEYR